MELKITLTAEEVNAILAVLGQTPTASNFWPLTQKIKAQTEVQLPKEEAPAN